MTTGQTIASPTPVHIKISAPIPKKISREIGDIFPKISRISISMERGLQYGTILKDLYQLFCLYMYSMLGAL